MTSQVLCNGLPIQPHLRGIICTTDADKNSFGFPTRRYPSFLQVPGNAEIISHVIEKIVPTAGHRNRSWIGKLLRPTMHLADFLRVNLKLPNPGQIQNVAETILFRDE